MPLTFHWPIGSGSFLLPVVTGAYITTLPPASRTVRSDVDALTVTTTSGRDVIASAGPPPVVPVGFGVLLFCGSFGDCADSAGTTGGCSGSTFGTWMTAPASNFAPGFNCSSSAGVE